MPPTPPEWPWASSLPPASPAPQAPRRDGTLILKVSRRILWVGSAALPLHNITRVEAFMIKADRGAVFVRFLRWLIVAALIYAAINYASDGGVEGNPVLLVVGIALFLFLLKELFQSPTPVLVVETAGGSTVVVTLPTVHELLDIAGRIAHAIDNPQAEFTAVVQQYNHTNNFGPVVHMNGGRNNRGINL
ncbi:DUF6232 family protein [Streptomyces zaomyceticus]|uniref:DUF6232 family protein n=1 Tax=Streptomyces zaomyceticus TaxID=68286 RepID=UPI00371DEC7C